MQGKLFEKLVAIEPVLVDNQGKKALEHYAKIQVYYEDVPTDNAEILQRIGDADAVLVSFTTPIDRAVIEAAPNLRYIGMCCSLYSPESANVDILAANERGIVVKGVLDYGDEGVPEYVVSELVRFLHGFGGPMWRDYPTELTGTQVGILGMGTTGNYVGRALRFFGADVSYYSRTRKPALETSEGYEYLPLHNLLERAEIVVTCLNKNVILLGTEEFAKLGTGKILVNISIGPGHDVDALGEWLDRGNYAFSDTENGIDPSGDLLLHPNVFCVGQSAGRSIQAVERLSRKVVANIQAYFTEV